MSGYNLPPGVTSGMIEDNAAWPDLEKFCDWLDGDTVPDGFDLADMKRAWLVGCRDAVNAWHYGPARKLWLSRMDVELAKLGLEAMPFWITKIAEHIKNKKLVEAVLEVRNNISREEVVSLFPEFEIVLLNGSGFQNKLDLSESKAVVEKIRKIMHL